MYPAEIDLVSFARRNSASNRCRIDVDWSPAGRGQPKEGVFDFGAYTVVSVKKKNLPRSCRRVSCEIEYFSVGVIRKEKVLFFAQ